MEKKYPNVSKVGLERILRAFFCIKDESENTYHVFMKTMTGPYWIESGSNIKEVADVLETIVRNVN